MLETQSNGALLTKQNTHDLKEKFLRNNLHVEDSDVVRDLCALWEDSGAKEGSNQEPNVPADPTPSDSSKGKAVVNKLQGRSSRRESSSPVQNFSILGVTTKGLGKFVAENGGESAFQGLTTAEVCERFLKPSVLRFVDDKLHKKREKGIEKRKQDATSPSSIVSLTREVACSYCELLRLRGSVEVGPAQVFISHAWRYNFLEVEW